MKSVEKWIVAALTSKQQQSKKEDLTTSEKLDRLLSNQKNEDDYFDYCCRNPTKISKVS